METEVLDGGVRYCDFPPVLRHAVSRPHQSVLAIVALERANHCGGDTKPQGQGQGQGIPLFLENLSYGQLQALSAVPADSLALDQDRSDGGNSAYVLTPPPIMEGRGVVKRFGSRVHVVPVHSGGFDTLYTCTYSWLFSVLVERKCGKVVVKHTSFSYLFNSFSRVE